MKIELRKNWKFRQAEQNEWLPATVPGTVHTDLFQNKKIEDPFYRTNERNLQWIDKVDWEYKTGFNINEKLLKNERIELVFYGLDTYADVFLNDELLLSTDNMFREWKVDCKNYLQLGKNVLRIYFHSPVKIDIPKLKRLGYQLPAASDQSENGELGDKKISIFARKAGFHYGWDWGPRFVTSGIWRPVYLLAWNNAKIVNIQIVQNSVEEQKAELSAHVEIESTGNFEGNLSVYLGKNKKTVAVKKSQLTSGLNQVQVEFEINNPELWWTNGLGEPHLYKITSHLKIENVTCDEKSTNFGIRTIKVVRKKDETGTSFYFKLNGVPVFAKGANYIPNDNFLPRVSKKRYREVIKSAVAANLNMLRVWGGGIYENDIFYYLCDKYGIMIWQDFMFACSMYPGDEKFMENVRQEAIQNVKRLRNHPCLVLWCGNNEIDSEWSHDVSGGWEEQFDEKTATKIWHDYEKLFHEVIPGIVKKYDPHRFYWHSSPLADFNERSFYESKSGDIHYWGVWHGKEPFENFQHNVGRFMSEYGFQSFPEFKTVKAFTIPEDWRINSEVMKAHQRSGSGNSLIKSYMDMYYREPKDFKSLLYVGQVLQAEAVKMAVEAHRRKMPFCMGSLYWQLNDCWPVSSWSSIDYFGRWKAVHYFAKKAFNNILISPTINEDKLKVFIVSDLLKPLSAKIIIEVMDFSGKKMWQKTIPVEVKANTSHCYFTENVKKIINGLDKKKIFLRTIVMNNDQPLSQNIFYFLSIKNLNLPAPKIEKTITAKKNGFRIRLSSLELAKNIYLSIDETKGFFTDNYFDLLPGEVVEVDFSNKGDAEYFKENLKIVSLRNSYQ